MNPILSELYSASKEKYQLNLIAGEKGLLNPITWVYLTEDIGNIDFLKGNELVITTGLSANSKTNWIYELTKELIYQECNGLIINIGKYITINDISNEVIELCNSENFPLFVMPWEIHISDIMQDFCNKIFINNYQINTLSKMFQNIISDPKTAQTHIPILNANGYKTDSAYRIVKLNNINSPLKLQNCMNELSIKHHLFIKNNHYILILQDCPQIALDTLIQNYYNEVNVSMKSDPTILRPIMGIGENVLSLSQLSFTYSDASYALEVAKTMKKDFLFFNDLGIFRILLSVPNKELLNKIYLETLSTLIDYDNQNKTELLNTLKLYLNFDGSIQETASALYTHRNTINYRMKKIQSLLQKNLNSSDVRFNLTMAFYIKEVLQLVDVSQDNI